MAAALPSAFVRGPVLTVHQGDCLVAGEAGVLLTTVLGSCISTCIWDGAARLGGMNHFLLAAPSASARDRFGESARYGAFAMEQLINKVLAAGAGRKADLVFKVFGGGAIHPGMTDIGADNIAFVRGFLREEGYAVAAEDLGGSFARKVLFSPADGKVFVKRLDSRENARVAREEIARARSVPVRAAEDVELF